MKILLCGATGFIGTTLVPVLDAVFPQSKIVLLHRHKSRKKIFSEHESLLVDRDSSEAKRAMAYIYSHEFDIVIDLNSLNIKHSEELVSNLHLKKIKKYVHLSSAAVYADPNDTEENSALGGGIHWGDYGVKKSNAEKFLKNTLELEGKLSIIRPPYMYGPNDSQYRATFIWDRLYFDKKILLPPGALDNKIQFCFVRDLADFIANIISEEIESGTYNLGSEDLITIADWVSLVSKVYGVNYRRKFQRDESINARKYFPFRDQPCYVNIDKLKKTNFKQISLESGLAETFMTYDHPKVFRPNAILDGAG